MSAFNYNLTKAVNNHCVKMQRFLILLIFWLCLIYLTSFPARQIRSRL